MKRTIRVTVDVELARDAFPPFGATSADQEHRYFESACKAVGEAVADAYQTQTGECRYVCSEFLHNARIPVQGARPSRRDAVELLKYLFGGTSREEARDAFVDSLSPGIHRELARGYLDDVCVSHEMLTPADSLRCLLEVPIPASLGFIRAIEAAESEVPA